MKVVMVTLVFKKLDRLSLNVLDDCKMAQCLHCITLERYNENRLN